MMEVIEINALAAALRDVGVFAVILVLFFYILARSPFTFELTGTYKISVGKNGKDKEKLNAPASPNPGSGSATV